MHFGVDLIRVGTISLTVCAIVVSEQQMILSCVGTVRNHWLEGDVNAGISVLLLAARLHRDWA